MYLKAGVSEALYYLVVGEVLKTTLHPSLFLSQVGKMGLNSTGTCPYVK